MQLLIRFALTILISLGLVGLLLVASIQHWFQRGFLVQPVGVALGILFVIAIPTVIFLEIRDWQKNNVTFLHRTMQSIMHPSSSDIKQLAASYIVSCILALFSLPPFFSWVSQNATTINATSTAVAAIATIIYVMLTYYLLYATVQAQKKQVQPYLSVYLEVSQQHRSHLEMVIHNHGNGAAKDISFVVSTNYAVIDSFPGHPGGKRVYLKDVPALQGLSFLAPQQQIRFYFGFLENLPKDDTVRPFTIDVKYKNVADEPLGPFSFPIDMARFRTPLIEKPDGERLAESMERMERRLQEVTSREHGVNVLVKTAAQAQREEDLWIRGVDTEREATIPASAGTSWQPHPGKRPRLGSLRTLMQRLTAWL